MIIIPTAVGILYLSKNCSIKVQIKDIQTINFVISIVRKPENSILAAKYAFYRYLNCVNPEFYYEKNYNYGRWE